MKEYFLLAASFLIFSSGAVRAAGSTNDWQTPLLTELKSHYQITTRNWLGKVQKPGAILIVAQDGIQADKPAGLMKPTIIQDGKITKAGGGGVLTGWGGRSLKQGEKVYVYDIRVKDEYILFLIATVNTIDVVQNGQTEATVQEGAISFRWDGSPPPTIDGAYAMIKPWLKVEGEGEAASASTVALGQTIADVEKELGQPKKIAQLGPKTMYFYTDMKVIFTDGKVTDVQ